MLNSYGLNSHDAELARLGVFGSRRSGAHRLRGRRRGIVAQTGADIGADIGADDIGAYIGA